MTFEEDEEVEEKVATVGEGGRKKGVKAGISVQSPLNTSCSVHLHVVALIM